MVSQRTNLQVIASGRFSRVAQRVICIACGAERSRPQMFRWFMFLVLIN